MESQITREAAWELLRKYNKDSFHLQHALTVEGVIRWYAVYLSLYILLPYCLILINGQERHSTYRRAWQSGNG